jgi:hypothetical protein
MQAIFYWLILQNKLWTADRITKDRVQTNQICQLCRTHPKTALHMLAPCPYSKMMWRGQGRWTGIGLQTLPSTSYWKFKIWWTAMMSTSAHDSHDMAQKVMYTTWNIWKGRCHRVFNNKAMTETQLQNVINNDVDQWRATWRASGSTQAAA